METALRGVSEGHYRANNEEGQRLLDGISTSLDRAHQEQQQASAQFQQAETYRKIASISEEEAATINSNATQEFMNSLQKDGQDLRKIEKTMVDHPEQAQARADEFVQSKVQKYFEEFRGMEGSSSSQVKEIYQENIHELHNQEKLSDSKSIYTDHKAQLMVKANASGLEGAQFIDKKSHEIVEKSFLNESQKVSEGEKHLESRQAKIDKLLRENQSRIRKHTEKWGFNQLDKEKD